MAYTANRSSTFSLGQVQGATGEETSTGTRERKESKTSHYAYVLQRDEEGNVVGKEYVNSLQIFENEGKFGNYLKIRVTGPVPTDDIFVQKKRAK